MGEFDLNLASRPFRSYRVANAGLILVLGILIVVSTVQIYGYARYSRLTSSIRSEVRSAQVEAEALSRQVESLKSKLDRPESAAKLNEVGYLNSLIARRDFPWTRIFARLEELMPDSVHLLNLHPEVTEEGVKLHIDVTGHTIADITKLIDALQESPAFSSVTVAYTEEKDATLAPGDVSAVMTVNYFPEKDTK